MNPIKNNVVHWINRRQLSFLFIVVWSSFSLFSFFKSFIISFEAYPYFWGIDLETKQRQLDGDLYVAAKVCERKIPTTEAVFFYNISSQSPNPYSIHSKHFFQQHDRQKLSYLLYPRQVYWDLQRMKEGARYILVYHTQLEVTGFEHVVDVKKDIYLLKRKKKE